MTRPPCVSADPPRRHLPGPVAVHRRGQQLAGAVPAAAFDSGTPARRSTAGARRLGPRPAPPATAYLASRAARGAEPGPAPALRRPRAAYVPRIDGHTGPRANGAWFPGGTVTPSTRAPGPADIENGTPCPSPNAPASVRRASGPRTEPPPPQASVVLAGPAPCSPLGGLGLRRSGKVPGDPVVLGLALGFVLFHSRFGFTSGWRQLVAVGQGAAMRAHMLMLAVACVLFAVILGRRVRAAGEPSLPVGIGLVVGAFLFGIGMQVGGSCASGTLFAVGCGQSAIVLTLFGFVVGSVFAALHVHVLDKDLPARRSSSRSLGYPGAWAGLDRRDAAIAR